MSLETPKIKAMIIVEVLGKPKEHLVETLEDIIKRIGEEKGVKVENKKIHDPKPLKEREDFFSSYAEIDLELDEIISLVLIMFKYMPSHLEINHPEKLILNNNDLSETLNEITRRLHQYDEIARVLDAEKKILENKLKKQKEEN